MPLNGLVGPLGALLTSALEACLISITGALSNAFRYRWWNEATRDKEDSMVCD